MVNWTVVTVDQVLEGSIILGLMHDWF